VRFFFPFSVCGSCCAVAGGQASRRSRFDLSPSCNTAEGRRPAEGLVLAVFRFVSIVRGARRRNHDSHRLARVIRRGLSFHAAFRYPFWRACHDWAGPTSLSIRQRSWDFAPFAVFLACGSRRLFPPFIPTCRLPIVQHRCFLRLLAAVSELLPSESGEIRPTAKRSTRLLGLVPQASQTNRIERCARSILPWVSWSSLRPSDVSRNQWMNQSLPKPRLLPPRQGRGIPSPCMHASEQTTRRRNRPSSTAQTISIRSWVS